MCSNQDENIICSVNYLPRNNSSRLVLRWDGDYKWTYRVCVVQIGRCPQSQGGARNWLQGLLSVLSPFLAVHPGAGTCGRKKKESRVSTGVILGSLDYSQLFPISRQGCKGNCVVVEYLPKEKGVPRQCATEEGLVVRTGHYSVSCV